MSKIELLCIDTDGTLTDGSLIYGFVGNLFWGNHLRCFDDKISLDEPQVLSRSFRAKTTQSTTAITSIVDSTQSAESNNNPPRHSELSQSEESKKNGKQFVDSSLTAFAQNDENIAESKNPAQQTIEGIAVEVAEFLPNFQGNFVLSGETGLGDREHAKFGKSPQVAPKRELQTSDTQICEVVKVFNVKDGLALAYFAKTLNRKVAIITGRKSEILRARAKELGIDELLFMGIRDKGATLRELKERFALDSSQIATIGDDLNDIPMFNESLCNFAPSDCADALKTLPNTTILNAKGGKGAVREAIEIILKKENLYEAFISQFV